jgi:hypothetical protein
MTASESRVRDTVREDDDAAFAGGEPLTAAEILAQIPRARARAAEEQKHGLRAAAARYSRAREQLVLELTNGTVIGVPVDIVPALGGASARDLAGVEVTPTGSALHWERLDVDLSVPGLVLEALGGGAVQSLFGVAGGRATSSRKAEAARANGSKGGRPPGTGAKKSGAGKQAHEKAAPQPQRGKRFPVVPEKVTAGAERGLGRGAGKRAKVAAKQAGGLRVAVAKSGSSR